MESIVWANLKPPINREIFENIIRSSDPEDLLEFLKIRQKTNGEHQISFIGGDITLNYQVKKLQELGMTTNEESQILSLYKLILEIVNSRKPMQNTLKKRTMKLGQAYNYHNYKNTPFNSKDTFPEVLSTIDFELSQTIESISGKLNLANSRSFTQSQGKDSAWHDLFDNKSAIAGDQTKNVELKFNLNEDEINNTEISKNDVLEFPFKKSENLKFTTSIYKGLQTGTSYVNNERNSKCYISYLPTAWKPAGILVGNLHEHRRGYTSVLAHPVDKQIISSGTDKTVKIWNCDPHPNKQDLTCSKYLPNKSSLTVSLEDNQNNTFNGSCQNLVWTDNFNSIAVVVDRKYIHVVERSGEKKELINFPTEKYGFINNLTTPLEAASDLDSTTQKTLIYSTTGNWIIAHDLRCPSPLKSIWCHKQDNDFGFITSLAVHSAHTWMVTGTSRGSLICWDLRFQKVVNQIDHPKRSGFLSVKINPIPREISENCNNRSAQVWAATEECNEISSWNLESSIRITSLRTSVPDVKQRNVTEFPSIIRQNSTNYVPNNNFHSKPFVVKLIGEKEQRPCILSGSSDFNLRYWDLNEHSKSCLISYGGLDQYSAKVTIQYKSFRDSANESVIEEKQNIEFIEENLNKKRDFQPFTGHVANICDITTVMLGQPFIVSSSMDGVIKIWK